MVCHRKCLEIGPTGTDSPYHTIFFKVKVKLKVNFEAKIRGKGMNFMLIKAVWENLEKGQFGSNFK